MSPSEPDRPKPLQFVSPLHKATRQLGEYMEADSRARGVEPGEGHLLSYATLYGPCPISRLARVFGHKPSTLTSMLDRLEARGLVDRSPNPDDRRSVLVSTTPDGSRIATELRERLESMEEGIHRRIDPRDLAGFQAVMRAIADLTRVDLERSEEEG